MKSHRVVRVVALLLALIAATAPDRGSALPVLGQIRVTASPFGPGISFASLINDFANIILPSFDPNESVVARFAKCQQARTRFADACPPETLSYNFDGLVHERMAGTLVADVAGFGGPIDDYRSCITQTDGTVWINTTATCAFRFAGALLPLCALTSNPSACEQDLVSRLLTSWDSGGLTDMPTEVRARSFAVEVCRELANMVEAQCEA
jgi:hypothetical protein